MKAKDAIPYIGHFIDDSGISTEEYDVSKEPVTLVGWQCGFEPMFVAVRSTLGHVIEEGDAEDIAAEHLESIGWFSEERTEADYTFQVAPSKKMAV